MSQKKIRLIIGLMTLALIGLISFQSYWLGFMLETKKEQLAADIRDGMEKVVRKLEKQELYVLSQKQREYESQQKEIAALEKKLASKAIPSPPRPPQMKDPMLAQHDPMELIAEDISHEFRFNQAELQAFKKFQQNEMPNDILYVRKSFMLPNGQIAEVTEEYQINADLKGINRRLREEKQLNEMMGAVKPRVLQELNRIKETNRLRAREAKRISDLNRMRPKFLAQLHQEDQQKTKKINALTIDAEKLKEEKAELQKVLKKTEMAKEVFADFLFKERPITQRVSTKHIDSLIKQELAEKGITMPYVFGIGSKESSKNKNWVYTSAGLMKTPRAQSASFITPLFPNDLRPSGQYLQIYFPNQEALVWEAMSFSFLGSALLLLTMIGCFYIAVMTILKQKKLAEVKNDFINNMTHEFKTPISTISLAAQLIQEESNGINNESINRYVGIIKEENIRLGRQVERVLQTAQMEKENIVLKKKEINLNTLVQQVADMNGPLIQSQGGHLNLLLDAQNAQIEVDEVHISNVLFNLLDNAIKYSKEKPEITISTNSSPTFLSIRISDQGIGMVKEVLGSVFEPFYRVPTGNVHNVKGFGLGLSYVKKIVEAHGGSVQVSSLPSIGSTFEINLPFHPTA
ncbi:GHKL domain-containing protein [Cytophagaceae bacterium 50C-KIRBA]|uniref:histidine kinase n=1 Tax=Aquirufa beregesia TaxID=2516556 RepID=A0ABX0F4U7_9BACT|nr:ATP-binding protein [Aquirufa beregesia]NGZ44880.1 GHKL domain-containing protein [Aquirufa beregesia]